jgi:TonB-linked outer membrane protein, SusC/RagA family
MYVKRTKSEWYKKLVLSVCAIVLALGTIDAQNIKVSGVILDTKKEPIPGVTILVKGTRTARSSSIDGSFTIDAPANATLQISSIGYVSQEFVLGGRTRLEIILEDDTMTLQEAVVTAEFGMKRVARAVGSSIQNVKASDIVESGRESFVSALQGRISGLTVTATGGTPGASTTVVLRNITSISGNNQPLYVVDGVPMNNSTFDPGSGFAVADNVDIRYNDFASRGNDINPDDIESMTVLKGAAAAALYGSDASNGAIIITTKKGSAGTGRVTYSNNFRISKAHGYPEIQSTYANGMYGTTNYYSQSRFGARYPDGVKLYDNIAAVLQTGFSQTHSVSVEGGSDKVTLRGSASYVDEKGVVKTTDYTRLNIALSGKAEITKWLNFESTMSYTGTTNTKVNKGTAGPLYRAVRWPMTDNMLNYARPDGTMRTPELYTDTDLLNPLYAMYKNRNYDETDRFMVNVGLNITPTKNTFVIAKMGWDIGSQTFENAVHPWYSNEGGTAYGQGTYNLSRPNFTDKHLNVLAGYNNMWGKFSFSAQVGYHQAEQGRSSMAMYGSKFLVLDFYSIANCDPATVVTSTNNTTKRVQGVSGQMEFGFNNMAFVTLRARNDWSSTLPIANRSYFYPAIEGSFVATELPFLQGRSGLSFLKLRGAIAQVGKDVGPLAVYPALESTGSIGAGFRYGYTGPNEALKPEMTTSSEFGFEARLFNDRVNMDFTYYWTKCEDQYIKDFRLSYATGFVLNNMNVGTFTTKGWDFHVDGDIIRSRSGLRWNVGVNLWASTSNVTVLPENVSEYYIAYTWVSGNLRNGIQVGHPVTTITGQAYERNKNGDILINPSTGIPVISSVWSVMGDRQPDLEYGINTAVSYKGFRLSALATGRIGASVVNGTKRDLMGTGSSLESVTLRESDPVVFKGVLKNGQENSANPTVNTIAVTYANFGSSIYTGGDEDWFEKNVNYLRLAEVRLSYAVPRNWLSKTFGKAISAANIWVAGSDLVVLTNYSGIDPVGNVASAALGGSGGVGMDYWGIPFPRGFSFGLSLTL